MPNNQIQSLTISGTTYDIVDNTSGYITADSPALTGTPTAPTPLSGAGDTQIATVKYVQDSMAGAGAGTVTSVGVANTTNGGLSVSGSPITGSGTISIGHSNVLTSAQTTSGIYPIKIDKNGHISEYGSAVSIPTISLNGSSTTSASFYAPTTAGTSGYVLTSNGSGAPTWAAVSGETIVNLTITYDPITTLPIYTADMTYAEILAEAALGHSVVLIAHTEYEDEEAENGIYVDGYRDVYYLTEYNIDDDSIAIGFTRPSCSDSNSMQMDSFWISGSNDIWYETAYFSSSALPTKTSDLLNDSGFITGMTILSYGTSTWNDFLTAYNANKVVYCRASSNSNPASGSQTRLAFMAYVNNATTPTSVEFQYYRSVNTHTASQQGDQVYVYTLTSAGSWSVTAREASVKVVAGTGLSGTYSNGTMTLTGPTNISAFTNDSGYITGVAGNSSVPVYVDSNKIVQAVDSIAIGLIDKPFIKAHGASTQITLSNAVITQVPLTVVDFATEYSGVSLDTTKNTILVEPGIYRVTGSIYLVPGSSGAHGVYIRMDSTSIAFANATEVASTYIYTTTSGTINVTVTVKAVDNCYIWLAARGTANTKVSPNSNTTYLEVEKIASVY